MQQASSCPGCGSPIKPDQQFCGICGTKLTIANIPSGSKCPNCGSFIVAGLQFCGNCGAKVSGLVRLSQVAKPEAVIETTPQPKTEKQKAQAVAGEIKPAIQGCGMLNTAGSILLALGWIVLIVGCLGSIGLIVLAALGGGLQLVLGGVNIIGTPAMIVGTVGLVLSFIFGFGLLTIARLCSAVVEIYRNIRF